MLAVLSGCNVINMAPRPQGAGMALGREIWLLIEWPEDEPNPTKYYCNLGTATWGRRRNAVITFCPASGEAPIWQTGSTA